MPEVLNHTATPDHDARDAFARQDLADAGADLHDGTRDATCDAWLRTIALLKPQHHTLTYSAEENALRAHAPIITIIERPNAGLAVVSWRDATHCRYGAQVWTVGTSREEGVCALSGLPIGKADLVFRPQRARPAPLNADAMILATAMDGACSINLHHGDDEPPSFHYRSNAR